MCFKPNPRLPSDSKEHACRTKGVRIIPKPRSLSIGLPPSFNGCRLNVVYHDGLCNSLRVSKRVAEVLATFIGTEA